MMATLLAAMGPDKQSERGGNEGGANVGANGGNGQTTTTNK